MNPVADMSTAKFGGGHLAEGGIVERIRSAHSIRFCLPKAG